MNFHFINVCWGRAYSKLCVEEMLPTLLSPGNFADPALKGRSKFCLYTTAADYEWMQSSPAMQRLQQLMEVVLIDITHTHSQTLGPGSDPDNKYAVMNGCHRHATQKGNDEKAAVVYLCPDMVASDGLCHHLVELADSGKSAVLIAGERLSLDGFQHESKKLLGDAASSYPGIAPREMVGIALRTMTRYTQSIFWDSPDVTVRPNQLGWRVDESGYFIRGFHLHPLMMRPEIRGTLSQGTIDGHFLVEACPHRDRYHFIEDSDAFCAFSLTSFDELPSLQLSGRYSEEAMAAYIASRTHDIGKQHILFARKILRFHTRDLDEKWAPVETESNRVLSGILRHLGVNQSRKLSEEQWTNITQRLLQAKGRDGSARPLAS